MTMEIVITSVWWWWWWEQWGWSMAIAAQVCIGAHLRVGVSNILFQENVRAYCAKSCPCTKACISLSSLLPWHSGLNLLACTVTVYVSRFLSLLFHRLLPTFLYLTLYWVFTTWTTRLCNWSVCFCVSIASLIKYNSTCTHEIYNDISILVES